MRHHNCVTTGLALRLWQVALSRFLSFAALLCLSLSFTAIPALGQSNPVPFVNQPLVPSAVAPGGPDFTLTVNGTGFVSGASEGTCPSCSIGGNGGSGSAYLNQKNDTSRDSRGPPSPPRIRCVCRWPPNVGLGRKRASRTCQRVPW